MGMQYDVKSKHLSDSGVAYGSRTRLKGAILSANAAAAARNVLFMDNDHKRVRTALLQLR